MEQFPLVRIKKETSTEIDPKKLIHLVIKNEKICDENTLNPIAGVRGSGELEGSAIFLNDHYEWVFGRDNSGTQMAIPLKKVT